MRHVPADAALGAPAAFDNAFIGAIRATDRRRARRRRGIGTAGQLGLVRDVAVGVRSTDWSLRRGCGLHHRRTGLLRAHLRARGVPASGVPKATTRRIPTHDSRDEHPRGRAASRVRGRRYRSAKAMTPGGPL